MVDAAARIGKPVETANLHLIRARAGLHAECAEERVSLLQLLYGDDLRRAAPAAQRDLILVGRPPALHGRRPVEHRTRLSTPAAALFRSRAGWLLCTSRISVPQHGAESTSRQRGVNVSPCPEASDRQENSAASETQQQPRNRPLPT